MRDRATAFLWIAAAAAAGGCMARGTSPEDLYHPPSPHDVDQLRRAVERVGRLQYEPAAATLTALLPKLRAAGDKARSAEAAFWLGYCCEKQGNRQAAAEWYRQARRENPNSPPARQAAERLSRLQPPATAPAGDAPAPPGAGSGSE